MAKIPNAASFGLTKRNGNKMFVEQNCTIEFQGRSFTAGGAAVSDTHCIAYPAKGGELHDWHGNVIGTYRVLSSRRAVFFGHRSWQGERYYFMRATVNGRQYSLRGFGVGMVAMGRALKVQS